MGWEIGTSIRRWVHDRSIIVRRRVRDRRYRAKDCSF